MGRPPEACQHPKEHRQALLSCRRAQLPNTPPAAGCALALAKAMLGAGLVALPCSLLLLGTLPAVLAFVTLGTLCQLSCSALAAAAAAAARGGLPAQRLSYNGVLELQLGPWAARLLDGATALHCLGVMTACLIASGDALVSDEWRAEGAPSWLAALLRSRPAVLALMSALVVAPLLSFRWAAIPPGSRCGWSGWSGLLVALVRPAAQRSQHCCADVSIELLLLSQTCRHPKQATAASALGVAAVLVLAGATVFLAAVVALTGRAHALPLWPPQQLHPLPWHRAMLRVAAVLPVVLMTFM